MAEFETILFEVQERVARITLNRPEQLNALSFAMRGELAAAFDRCAADPDVRAVLLAGPGRAFCAGIDLADGSFEEGPIESLEARTRGDFRAKLTGLGKPSVAAVQGFCLGGGCELALCCDLRMPPRTRSSASRRSTWARRRRAAPPSGCRASLALAVPWSGCSPASACRPPRPSA